MRIPIVMFWVIALSMGGLGRVAPAAGDQLPQDLRVIRDELGCAAVADFYERPGMVDPPYVYGVFPGDREQSAAFWCLRSGAEYEKRFWLVIVESGRVTSKIPWGNPPGGLSVPDAEKMPLFEFRYVEEPERVGPSSESTRHPPLHDEYDGNITLFYREGGRWLFRQLD